MEAPPGEPKRLNLVTIGRVYMLEVPCPIRSFVIKLLLRIAAAVHRHLILPPAATGTSKSPGRHTASCTTLNHVGVVHQAERWRPTQLGGGSQEVQACTICRPHYKVKSDVYSLL